jgi:hypothetical protein
MGFHTEEEIDLWYASEKENLDSRFMADIDRDAENIPKHREKYELAMKKLISKYQMECQRIVDSQNVNKKKRK